MPQMAPLNWIIMFLLMMKTIYFTMSMQYFQTYPISLNMNKKKIKKTKFNLNLKNF